MDFEKTSIIALPNFGMSGHPLQETRLPSTTSGASMTVAPAFSMSPVMGGKHAVFRPFSSPYTAGTCAPWHTSAIGRLRAKKCSVMRLTSASTRIHSGARPPG